MGVFITEAWRSDARQTYLRLRRLSKTKVSYHQKGLAIDVAFKDDPRTKQVERELYPPDHSKWREIASIAKKYGIDWGYDLWKWDKPHFQDNGTPLKEIYSVPAWANEAVLWCKRKKIINGNNINDNVTKAEMCVMLKRLHDLSK